MKNFNPFRKRELKHFLYTFQRQPILLSQAKGSYVWDLRGKKYLDFFSGLAVCGVGHNHKRVVGAIKDQTSRLLHVSNYFYTQPQMNLAQELTSRWKGSRVFFSNSGAEANEMAIKLARLWGFKNKKIAKEIISFKNSFHGRTLATFAASGWKKSKNDPFQPYPPGFKKVPFNNLSALKKIINSKTLAILIEPVQGEGGIHIAESSFFKGVYRICKKKKILLIVDEVQSGMGRTGRFFGFEHYGIKPDIVTLAKGLAGGMPLGATLAQGHVSKWVQPGMHGSTFGGNPVSCAASLEVLKLLSPRVLRGIQKTGKEAYIRLQEFKKFPSVKQIRGLGLLLAIELKENGFSYVNLAREKGLLINCTQGNVLRFLPPYFIGPSDLNWAISILKEVFEAHN